MASGKPKAALSDQELLASFDDIPGPGAASKPSKGSRLVPKAAQVDEYDPLADLEKLAQERPTTRPQTPKPAAATNTQPSSKKSSTAAPTLASTRTSEDKPNAGAQTRKSGESARSFHQAQSAAAPEANSASSQRADPAPEPVSTSGGWWGSLVTTATATATSAIKQAEALAKEIQKNEEAQRWATQVQSNVGALRGLGGELRSRALPTFTNILHTLAPPISQHERLQIHITHDFIGYPSLDPLIYTTFSRIMAQVEGGDLMVIQRGQESRARSGSDVGYSGSGAAGWSDGPWWRQTSEKRDLGLVKGLVEGSKLARVSAETHAHDFYASRGGVEEAARRAAEAVSESNPTRDSDIFLSIQAISTAKVQELFGGRPEKDETNEGRVAEPAETEEEICFAIYLHDAIHGITFHTVTQALPSKWTEWLDSQAYSNPEHGESATALPEEIAEIINSGGVDPREWVSEWVEEVLGLGIGVVAQRYVA
jgi:hypothetical protein